MNVAALSLSSGQGSGLQKCWFHRLTRISPRLVLVTTAATNCFSEDAESTFLSACCEIFFPIDRSSTPATCAREGNETISSNKAATAQEVRKNIFEG